MTLMFNNDKFIYFNFGWKEKNEKRISLISSVSTLSFF